MNARTAPFARLPLRSLALLPVLALTSAAQMGEDPPPPASEIAKLRFEVPPVPYADSPDMIIQGTIPLPKGMFVEGDPVPFKVVNYDGSIVNSTQVEVVTRYPDATGNGVKVAEISARIDRKPSWVLGKRKTVDVIFAPGAAQPDPGSADLQDLLNGPANVPADVQALLGNSLSIALVGKGPQGEEYVSFPLDGTGHFRTDRYGPVRSGLRVYQQLQLQNPQAGDLTTLLGAHVYLETLSDENSLRFGVRFNNASDDATESPYDNARGEVFFDSLSLYVIDDGRNWTALQQFADPYGTTATTTPTSATLPGSPHSYRVFPIVSELGGVQSHFMPCRAQFLRRFVIAPEAEVQASSLAPQQLLAQAGQAFSKWGTDSFGNDLNSWWADGDAGYLAQDHRLAKLSFANTQGGTYTGGSDMRTQLSSWYASLRNALANNSPITGVPFNGSTNQLGWARPLWDPYGGATGGGGIQYLDGDRTAAVASPDGYRLLMLRHRLVTERMGNVLYGLSGEHTSYDDWVRPHPTTGEPYYLLQGGFVMDRGWNDADFCPSVTLWNQNAYIGSVNGQPSYYNELLNYDVIDVQHHPRHSSPVKALAWLGNDPMAKDDLRAQAELFRMTFSEHANLNGNSVGWSLSGKQEQVLASLGGIPGWGLDAGRGQGWGMDLASAAFALGDDDYRLSTATWFLKVAELFSTALGATTDPYFVDGSGTPYDWGFWGGKVNGKLYGTGAPVRARQTWEDMILAFGLEGVRNSVFATTTSEHTDLSDAIQALHFGLLAPVSWNEAAGVIWSTGPTTPNPYPGSPVIYNCDPQVNCLGLNPIPTGSFGPYGTGNAQHYTYSALGDGNESSADELFLARAYRILTGGACSSCPDDLRDALQELDPRSNYSGWSNQVHLLGLVQ